MGRLHGAILEMISSLERRNVHGLRSLSNSCLHELAVNEESSLLQPAILAYALAKVMEKQHFWRDRSQDDFFLSVSKKLREAEEQARAGDDAKATSTLTELIDMLEKLDVSEQRFVRSLLNRARVKSASTLYAQGFSLGRALEITGADKRDVVDYIGKTVMFDRVGKTKTMQERLKALKKLITK